MNIAKLSDSETTRDTYDKDVKYVMSFANLSDSETARNTYDKDVAYLLKDSILTTLFLN